MSVEYPTDKEMREFLSGFVAPPVIDQMQKWALTNGRPLRKVVGVLIEGAWASHVVNLLTDLKARENP